MRRIYMDANATTPLLPEVLEAMHPFWIESFGNASSIHQPGQHARAAVDHARESMARLLHCRASEIVFTSGGTESDNLALFGVLQPSPADLPAPGNPYAPEKPPGSPALAPSASAFTALAPTASPNRLHLITTGTEHHAVLHAAQSLADQSHLQTDVTFLPCNAQGLVDPADLKAAIQPNTRLVSIMLANNETGVIQPIRELAEIAHAAGALFHTDAVQAAGKLPIDVAALGCDLLSISGHKMYAPQGTGVLYVRRNVRLAPLFHGGTHERQRRAGTENVPGIVGLGKAAELAQRWIAEDAAADGPTHLASLRDQLEQGLLGQIDEAGINGFGAPRVPNTTNLYFDHVEAEALVIALDLKGLSVSGGSACQSGATEPSHVLSEMGLSPARARASIRLSLTRMTSAEDIRDALTLVPAAVARLRDLSPSYRGSRSLVNA